MREIIMKTTFGDLVACEGGDVEFPEILVFLRNKDGHELIPVYCRNRRRD